MSDSASRGHFLEFVGQLLGLAGDYARDATKVFGRLAKAFAAMAVLIGLAFALGVAFEISWLMASSLVLLGVLTSTFMLLVSPAGFLAAWLIESSASVRRWVHFVAGSLLWFLFVALYFAIMPVHRSPSTIPLVLLLFAMLAVLSVRYGLGPSPKRMYVTVVAILIITGLSLRLPKTFSALGRSSNAVDDFITHLVMRGTDATIPEIHRVQLEDLENGEFIKPNGDPKYWFAEEEGGRLVIYDGPGFTGRGVELQPIDRTNIDTVEEWIRRERSVRAEAAAEAQRPQTEAAPMRGKPDRAENKITSRTEPRPSPPLPLAKGLAFAGLALIGIAITAGLIPRAQIPGRRFAAGLGVLLLIAAILVTFLPMLVGSGGISTLSLPGAIPPPVKEVITMMPGESRAIALAPQVSSPWIKAITPLVEDVITADGSGQPYQIVHWYKNTVWSVRPGEYRNSLWPKVPMAGGGYYAVFRLVANEPTSVTVSVGGAEATARSIPSDIAIVQKSLHEGIADLATQIQRRMSAENKRRVAVVPFFDLGKATTTLLGSYLSEELVTKILIDGKLEVVESEFLDEVIEGMKIQVAGAIDPQTAREVGKLAGVDSLLTGTVTDLGALLALNCRLIDAQSGKVFSAAQVKIVKDESLRAILSTHSSTTEPAAPPMERLGTSDSNSRKDGSASMATETRVASFDAGTYTVEVTRTVAVPGGVETTILFQNSTDDIIRIAIDSAYVVDTSGARLGLRYSEPSFRYDAQEVLPHASLKTIWRFGLRDRQYPTSSESSFSLSMSERWEGQQRRILINGIKIQQ